MIGKEVATYKRRGRVNRKRDKEQYHQDEQKVENRERKNTK